MLLLPPLLLPTHQLLHLHPRQRQSLHQLLDQLSKTIAILQEYAPSCHGRANAAYTSSPLERPARRSVRPACLLHQLSHCCRRRARPAQPCRGGWALLPFPARLPLLPPHTLRALCVVAVALVDEAVAEAPLRGTLRLPAAWALLHHQVRMRWIRRWNTN